MDRMPWDDDGEGWKQEPEKPGKKAKKKAKKRRTPWRDSTPARVLKEARAVFEPAAPPTDDPSPIAATYAAEKVLSRACDSLLTILDWKGLPDEVRDEVRGWIVCAIRQLATAEGILELTRKQQAKQTKKGKST